MKKNKEQLANKGWHVSNCCWQLTKGTDNDKHLECYIISRYADLRVIIIQFHDDGSESLFSNDLNLI